MSQIGSVHKLAGSKFLSLYQLDAVRRDGGHFDYYMASRTGETEKLKAVTHENRADGVVIFAVDPEDRVVLIRQYRYTIGGYIYEFPAGLVEPGEDFHEGAVREMFEETGLKLEPLKVDEAFEKPYFTTIGMTDESCATVYGYASGEVSKAAQEDSEEIEVVIADRDEVRRILKEERVAIMCAYMLMHFLKDEEVFGFLGEI